MGKTINKAQNKSGIKDLTEGNPMKLILEFAVPLLGGLLFQQLYSMVDTMIVGRTLGKDALAGVGATGSINFMVIGFCIGVCAGFAIPISQQFGAKDYGNMRRFCAHSIYLTVIFAAVMTVTIAALTGQILVAMNTPSNILSYSYDYIFVIFLGIPAIYLYNLSSSTIRALGDSKMPVVFLIIASVVNIILDLFFIMGLGMGVEGAAWATNVSQFFSGVLCCLYIWKKVPLLHFEKGEMRPGEHYFHILLFMGVPMGLQYSITAIGSVVLQTAVNGLGSDYVATMTAASKVSMFFCIPFDAIGTTMATWAGQNIGAKKLDRLNKGLKDAFVLGMIYAVAAFIVLFIFGRQLTTLFISASETSILNNARFFLVCNSAFFIPLLFVNALRFMIQGMGHSGLAILSGVCEMAARVLVAVILIPLIGFPGACFASPLAWVCADLFLFPTYFKLRKKTYRDFGMAEQVSL